MHNFFTCSVSLSIHVSPKQDMNETIYTTIHANVVVVVVVVLTFRVIQT